MQEAKADGGREGVLRRFRGTRERSEDAQAVWQSVCGQTLTWEEAGADVPSEQ